MLFRAFQAADEAAQLLLLVDVQEELDDPRSVVLEELLELVDRLVPVLELLGRSELVPALDQDGLKIRTVENHDFAAARHDRMDAPEEVVRLLEAGRRLERLDAASLRIHG